MKNKDSGRGADDETWEKFVAYWDAMANGVDELGNVLYEDGDGIKWGAILVFGTGDLEQLVHWGIRSYNDTHEMCGFCLGNRSDIPHTDLQEDSEWRNTCPLSNEDAKKC